jgi:radical SAM superfamily enzyme YgiQ (UPF0313 family)
VTSYDVFASRGCPNLCSYCMAGHWKKIYKDYGAPFPNVRLRSPEAVINELKAAKDRLHIRRVRFKDSVFGYRRSWFYRFMDLYDREIGLPFTCFLESNFIDEARIRRLQSSGLNRTTVGIQAVSPFIRKEVMGRRATDDEIVAYAEMLSRNGIAIQYDLIHWNPFDTHASLQQGIPFLKRLPKGEDVILCQLVFFPRSRLDEKYQAEKPQSLSAEEFEYYAWIFQMIMSSPATEKLADTVLGFDYFKRNPRVLRELFIEESRRHQRRYKIGAARDIRKGEIVTNAMVVRVADDRGQGVEWVDKERILNKIAREPVTAGSLLQWQQIFGTYENKYQ